MDVQSPQESESKIKSSRTGVGSDPLLVEQLEIRGRHGAKEQTIEIKGFIRHLWIHLVIEK
jgi:hypothetical protein